MDKNNDILHEAKKLRLLAAALELQHFTSTAANVVPIPGTERFVVIGTPAEVRGLLAAPNCGACPGDGTICPTSCRLAQESPPVVTTSSASGECGTAFGLLREVLAQHDEQGQNIRAEGDHPVPNPLAERIRALLDSRVIEGQGDGKAFAADLSRWILRDFDRAAAPSRDAAPQIKRWEDRLNAVDPMIRKKTKDAAKDAEIADLRAALAEKGGAS